jgi:hypothetical protein
VGKGGDRSRRHPFVGLFHMLGHQRREVLENESYDDVGVEFGDSTATGVESELGLNRHVLRIETFEFLFCHQ